MFIDEPRLFIADKHLFCSPAQPLPFIAERQQFVGQLPRSLVEKLLSVAEPQPWVVDEPPWLSFSNLVEAFVLSAIRRQHGIALPRTGSGALVQPKSIVIDPRRGFGQTVIAGTGISTIIVAERHRAGDSLKDLAADYRLREDLIEDALRFEYRHRAAA